MADLVENDDKERGILIKSNEIDHIVIYEDKISIFILPTGHFSFDVTNKRINGSPFAVSVYDE